MDDVAARIGAHAVTPRAGRVCGLRKRKGLIAAVGQAKLPQWVIQPVVCVSTNFHTPGLCNPEALINAKIAVPVVWGADVRQDVWPLLSVCGSGEAVRIESLTLG